MNKKKRDFEKLVKKLDKLSSDPEAAHTMFVRSAHRLANMDADEIQQMVSELLEPDIRPGVWDAVVANELNWLSDAKNAYERLETQVTRLSAELRKFDEALVELIAETNQGEE